MNQPHLAPVDETVKIPQAVRAAAARAESHYAKAPEVPVQAPVQPDIQAANTGNSPDQPINITAQPAPEQPVVPRPLLTEPVPDQVQPTSPQPGETPQQTSPQPGENWEHRYLSMKGRYDQSQQIMSGMQEQMAQMGRELERLSNHVNNPPTPPKKLVTEKDVETYGSELIDLTKRAAREAVEPEIAEARARATRAEQRAAAVAQQEVHRSLDHEVPNWREVNVDPNFINWLRLRDVYSGAVRQELLNHAFQAANAPRVLQFFKGYLAEAQATGQLPAQTTTAATPVPPRVAAMPLDTLVAPGRAQPAPGTSQLPADKPVITHKQIREFYSQEGRKRYAGREADRKADEEIIFEAQREGRVR